MRGLAAAFIVAQITTVDLHRCLSQRVPAIEGDLWGLAFEVGDGNISAAEARRWLAEKYLELGYSPSTAKRVRKDGSGQVRKGAF